MAVLLGLMFFLLTLRSTINKKQINKENKKLKRQNTELKLNLDADPSPLTNPNPVMKIDNHGICQFANHGSEKILSEWKTRINQKVPPEWAEVVNQIILSDKAQMMEIECGKITYLASMVPVAQREVHLFAMDITDYKSLEEALEDKEINDHQTNLPNRVVFRQLLEDKAKRSEDPKEILGILIVRFDDYSQTVFTYGQEVANAILVELANRLRTTLDESTHISRIGENEFGILNTEISHEHTTSNIIHPIIQSCTKIYQVNGHEIYISVSIGATLCPVDGRTPEALARNAHLALNRAANSNQNYAFFQRGMNESVTKQREMVAQLYQAITKNEFVLVYQPQINISSGKMIGCESLIRWHHPTQGIVSPFDFIPLAEKSNLISQIGEWVLTEACQQIQKWQKAGYKPLKVAVNLSAQHILEKDIIASINKNTKAFNVTPEWLSFELTESALVENKNKAISVMQQLRELGFELSIDDFGTGYSSLSYLIQFPIDKLKIDRSFIVDITSLNDKNAVLKGIIDLGYNMNLKCVAEGVETDTQLAYLKQQKCHIIQGYIFGKPEPASIFAKYFDRNWKTIVNDALSASKAKGPIKVGILHSYTGPMAISEIPVANASLMAIDELNQSGGLLGRQIIPIEADGQSLPEIFAKKAEELIVNEKVDVIFGVWNSHSRKAVKPIIEKYQHVMFYPMAYEGVESSNNIIYTGGTPNQILIPVIKWAIDNLGKKFFLVGSDYVGPRVNNAIASDQIKNLGGKVVGDEYNQINQTDFENIVDKIVETKPDVILNAVNGEANYYFFETLREHGISSDITPTISTNIGESELRRLSADTIAGDYLAWNYFQDISSDINQRFITKFKKTYDGSGTNDVVEAGYFGVYLWAEAVLMAGSCEPLKVLEKIPGMKFQAPGGPVQVDNHNLHTWKVGRIGRINPMGETEVIWSSVEPIPPIPYMSYRTEKEWEDFLQTLYQGWGNQWYPQT